MPRLRHTDPAYFIDELDEDARTQASIHIDALRLKTDTHKARDTAFTERNRDLREAAGALLRHGDELTQMRSTVHTNLPSGSIRLREGGDI